MIATVGRLQSTTGLNLWSQSRPSMASHFPSCVVRNFTLQEKAPRCSLKLDSLAPSRTSPPTVSAEDGGVGRRWRCSEVARLSSKKLCEAPLSNRMRKSLSIPYGVRILPERMMPGTCSSVSAATLGGTAASAPLSGVTGGVAPSAERLAPTDGCRFPIGARYRRTAGVLISCSRAQDAPGSHSCSI